MATLDPFI